MFDQIRNRLGRAMNREWQIFAAFLGVFLFAYFVPLATPQFAADADPIAAKITGAIVEAFVLLQWYARNHTLACVVPALFIAGAITTFLSKETVLKHLGPKANKAEAYSVASVSGTVLAVCSCSVLPMFAGIYRIGAGLGPAACFLYAGPAINVLAIFLTARVLGFELGIARVLGAIVFGVIIGILMAILFRQSEEDRSQATVAMPDPPAAKRPLWQNASLLAAMLAFLIFSDWFNPGDKQVELADGTQFAATLQYETENSYDLRLKEGVLGHETAEVVRFSKASVAKIQDVDTWVTRVHHYRWYLAGVMGALVVVMSLLWLDRVDFGEWMGNTWEFSKLLVPLLFGGVFVVGFLGALVPEKQVAALVGDNSIRSNLIASVIGCLFYFATLTEVPILEALMRNGMTAGPALALLLAGPALSLPSILVIRSVIGNVKTAVFVALVVVMATVAGMGFGALNLSEITPTTVANTAPSHIPLTKENRRLKTMTTIQVLGTGCRKCVSLRENAEKALKNLGVEADVQKIEDINEIVKFGVMSTPALAVDGEVKIVGKVASPEEIMAVLSK